MYDLDRRPFQRPLVHQFVQHMIEGGAPCLVSPTGSGKTVMLAEATRLFRSWNYQVVLAAHRNEIIKQLAKSCSFHCGEPVGFYTADYCTEDRGIIVTMMPTLNLRRDALPLFRGRVFLLDEGHHIQAKSNQQVIKTIQPSFFGAASATPITPTGAGLKNFGITKLIKGPQPAELMEDGSLCTYRMFCGKALVNTDGVPKQGGDLAAKKLEERILEVEGDFVRDLQLFNPDLKPTLAVTVTVDHARLLAEEYRRHGISAELVIGSTKNRDDIFDRFKAGKLKVIVSVAVVDEGLDLPEATCLQLIRPTRSLRLWKQLIGRVLRVDENNPDKVALIIDHGNCWKYLPLPHKPIEWTLEGKVKFKPDSLTVDRSGLVVKAEERQKRTTVVQGNRRQMHELDIDGLPTPEAIMAKRVKGLKRNLFLVEEKRFNPNILWPWANNPEGLSRDQMKRVELALGLPPGFCETRKAC